MKLAMKTMPHRFIIVPNVISRDMTLEIIRLLPVKSSPPAITTSIRPTLKAAPLTNFVRPMPSLAAASKVTAVARKPPKPMYAPARIPRTKTESQGEVAFATPMV